MNAFEPASEALPHDLESACSGLVQKTRRQVIDHLHDVFRRLRLYASEEEWIAAVLDGASAYANRVALFALEKDSVKVRGQRNANLPEDLQFSLATSRAFASAVQTRDPAIALRTESEVGPALCDVGGRSRAHLFPIPNGDRVAAILFAFDDANTDSNGLELISAMASVVLERSSNRELHAQIASPPPSEKRPEGSRQPPTASRKPSPSLSALSLHLRTLHMKAQRFSRVAVAEIQLKRPAACRAGREEANLYRYLQPDIDKARDRYRNQFLIVPSMVDYLHLELVRAAAGGDDNKMGAEYPGPLV
jgi:hypothetical protein